MTSALLGIDIGGGSVKTAGVADGRTVWTGASSHYARPTRERLIAAVREAVSTREVRTDVVGLCVPGFLDDRKERVTFSVNVPSLQETPLAELVRDAIGEVVRVVVSNDAHAAGWDLFTAHGFTERMLCLVLGTGVGAAVTDPHGLLLVHGESPGHLGQIDVSLEGEPVVGNDGGAGSLEGYIGSAALVKRYGPDPAEAFRVMKPTDPPIRALVRAIRICHAIYRPRHVVLAGGTGIRLTPFLPTIKSAVDLQLTSVADRAWDITTGDHDHHAAAGAAKLAMRV